jgi:hypothetical protein
VTFSISNDELLSIPANCERSATRHDEVRCVVDIAASSISSELTFTIRTSTSLKFGRFGTAVTTIGSKSWRDEVILARDFVVTNVADSGAGSLRAAIEQVNQQCATNSDVSRDGPCRISFAIDAPLPASGWYTIAPKTPLPALTAYDVTIDGSTQANDFGAPKIMLDGRDVQDGHGLELHCSRADIIDVAIGSFPQNGIFAIPRPSATYTGVTVVAYNAQAGLSVTNGSELAIGANRFFNNAGAAIDFGLNGRGGAIEPAPAIRAATYANGVTTIEGTAGRSSTVFLYASGQLKADGSVEAEQFIGQLSAGPAFTLAVPRDLRGLYISASSSAITVGQIPSSCICDVPEQHLLSTELSAPRRVD